MSALPQGFLTEISRYEQLSVLSDSLLQQPEVSVRVNRSKVGDFCVSGDVVPWCAEGFYLSDRPQFTFDPAMHQGLYYVQDASSMAFSAVVRQLTNGSGPQRYLDACAAPGGKTTAALAALPAGSVVVANEFDYRRAEILVENLSKWGNPNVLVSRGDTSRLGKLRNYFDIVAVDAPCSGEGMMRKDSQAVDQWSTALIDQCAATQREILANVWDSLRPGGYLIYSTCTFNTTENEHNLSWIVDSLGGQPVEIDALSSIDGIVRGLDTPYPCYRFLPGKIRGEGLFIAVVKKDGSSAPMHFRSKPSKSAADISSRIKGWFNQPMDFVVEGDVVYALPESTSAFIKSAAVKLDVLMMGVEVANIKGKDLVPTHQLVLSSAFDPEAFCKAEIDYAEAMKYLQRDNISITQDTPKGYVTLMYEHHPLGIVKHLGNRSNSLMPKQWRVLSKNIPDQHPRVLSI